MRVLGIDHGERRVGLALSDALGIAAHPLRQLTVESDEEAIAEIRDIVEEHEVDRFVVGLPLNMNGSEGPQTAAARAFAERLEAELGLPVEMQDERWSTRRAERTMVDADLTRAKRKKRRDVMAAQFVLQAWLDAHKSGGNCE
jgi:putative Holliday junction resolvase